MCNLTPINLGCFFTTQPGWQFCEKNAGTGVLYNWTYWLATGGGDACGALVGFFTSQAMRYYVFGDLSLREGAFPVFTLLEGFEVSHLLQHGLQ